MRRLGASLAVLVLATTLVAQDIPQRFNGTTPNPVTEGGTLTVKYTNSARANTTITIRIHDGGDVKETRDLEIKIGSDGVGTADFPVPTGWIAVVLTFDDSADYSVPVVPPSPGDTSASGLRL